MNKKRFDTLYEQEPAAAIAAVVRESFPELLASASNETLTSEYRESSRAAGAPPRKSFTVKLSNGTYFHIYVRQETRVGDTPGDEKSRAGGPQ